MGAFGFSFNFDPASFFQRRDRVTLPQHDTPAELAKRKTALSTTRASYVWDDRTVISGAVLIDDLPRAERPSASWIESLAPVLLRVSVNERINADEATAHSTAEDAVLSVRDMLSTTVGRVLAMVTAGKFGPNDAVELSNEVNASKPPKPLKLKGPGTIEQHKELFENIQLDVVAKDNQFMRDDIFAWYRVAGPNPMRITKCGTETRSATTGEIMKGKDTTVEALFPELTDTTLRGIKGFENDSLKEMTTQNRVYFVSYPEFDGVPTGLDHETKQVKNNFLYAPTCVLAVPKGLAWKGNCPSSDTCSATISNNNRVGLLPVAIRCGQKNVNGKYPMFTANAAHTDTLTWQAAKITVQVADAVMHEAVYHLGRTHLLMEVFICATHRALASSHPVYRLLKSHFYGTAFINSLAAKLLINPGGIIDKITAPDVRQTQTVSAAAVSGPGTVFNDLFVDVDLQQRGVMHSLLNFPYRDDALRIWNAILTWVGVYISAYYKSDADVMNDTELANWVHELTDSDKGGLSGFGDQGDGSNKITTVKYLTRVIAHCVFTASAQHAAVNFPQGTMMQFAPAMPLAGYQEAPTIAKAAAGSKQEYGSVDELSRKMLPTLENSEQQLSTAETIGVMQYSVLGEYGRSLEFAPEEVSDAMETFQMELGVIDGDVQRRNKEEKKAGLPVYKHLSPKNIPNSINV